MKFGVAVGAAILGWASAAATVVLHDLGWMLLLGWSATLLTLWAMRPGLWRIAYAGGWMTATALAVTPGPGGGYLVGADAHGYLVLALALVVLSVSIATLPLKRRRRLAGHDQPPGDAYDLAR